MVIFLTPTMIEVIPINNSTSTLNILRTVAEDKAFYFYMGIDRPLNVRASNLKEFLEKLGSVDIGSIEFHLTKGDFEKWIGMLGDHTLAQSIAEMKSRNLPSTEFRQRLVDLTGARISRLEKIQH
ncbi:MAG: DUF5752 family protein [Nitrososphaerales archaeon]